MSSSPTMVKLARVLALTLTLGCGAPDFPVQYQLGTGDKLGADAITKSSILLADNQQNYLFGQGVWIRTKIVDKFVGTAIRAPQLDLFGPEVLKWVVDRKSSDELLLHLGDGLNTSCVDEFDRFLAVMNSAQSGWFMAPGNHDGIYFGSNPVSAKDADWNRSCNGGGGPMTQASFVERYVREGLARWRGKAPPPNADPGTADFAATPRSAWKGGNWAYSGTAQTWLKRVSWRVDDAQPHRSFVVQQLDATLRLRGRPQDPPRQPTPTTYILLDTANYENAPSLVPLPGHPNPGATGDVSRDQLEIVEGWLKADRAASATPPVVVLMAHHPFGSLTARAKKELAKLRRDFDVLVYISAHTHAGAYFVNQDEESSWLELNVGSTIDWPLEYRTLTFVKDTVAGGRIYSNSTLQELGRLWTDNKAGAPGCQPEWQPQAGDADYPPLISQGVLGNADLTNALLLDGVLASYARLLQLFPSSDDNGKWPAGCGCNGNDGVQAFIASALQQPKNGAGVDVKRRVAAALERYDQERSVRDPAAPAPSPDTGGAPPAPPGVAMAPSGRQLRDEYRLCQAIWASSDDQNGVRKARREDGYVTYPPRQKP